jgi:hypothetical protein
MKRSILLGCLSSVALCIGAAQVAKACIAPPGQPGIRTPNPSYVEWSAKWWQWALGLPLEGHPFIDSPEFQVSEGQSGNVWFLAAPIPGPTERTCTIPFGKSLFVGLVNSEWSSLEGYASEEEQRATAQLFGDHIVGVFCTLDGVPVANIGDFRFQTRQFTFTAPSPWIFGDTGGTGTTVADGYYVMYEPLSTGQHVLHYGGGFHFSVAEGDDFDLDVAVDMTYNLTQLGNPGGGTGK